MSLKKNNEGRERGFTLIELLVVISIIALLSSITLATLSESRNRAKRSAFVQGMKQMQLALELYKSDNGHYPYENWGDQVDPETVNIRIGPGGTTDTLTDFLSHNAGSNSNDTDSVDFMPRYLSSLPQMVLPKAGTPATLSYWNQSFVTSFVMDSYTCGGAPLKGYVLYYEGSLTDYKDYGLELPKMINETAGGTYTGQLCITGS